MQMGVFGEPSSNGEVRMLIGVGPLVSLGNDRISSPRSIGEVRFLVGVTSRVLSLEIIGSPVQIFDYRAEYIELCVPVLSYILCIVF